MREMRNYSLMAKFVTAMLHFRISRQKIRKQKKRGERRANAPFAWIVEHMDVQE